MSPSASSISVISSSRQLWSRSAAAARPTWTRRSRLKPGRCAWRNCRSSPFWCRCSGKPRCCRSSRRPCAISIIRSASSTSRSCSRPTMPKPSRRHARSASRAYSRSSWCRVPNRRPSRRLAISRYASRAVNISSFTTPRTGRSPISSARSWQPSAARRRTPPACNAGSATTMAPKTGSPACSRSIMRSGSTRCCRAWNGSAYRFLSAAPRIIFVSTYCANCAPGIRSTSPRTPISASASDRRDIGSALSIRRPMKRQAAAPTNGCASAHAGSRAICRRFWSTPDDRFSSYAIPAFSALSASSSSSAARYWPDSSIRYSGRCT